MTNLFYLILFLLPANLAKHFILPFSYVNGYLVDYLIPAVYLTDILIILLLIVKPIKTIFKPALIFLLCLIPSVIFSASFWPAAYKFTKIIELVLFGLWIYQYKSKISRDKVIKVLSFSVLFQSLLAIGQFIHQGSLFSYWFFGEQPYNSATLGVDKIIWLDGSLKLPPLGTFPHPNVLAGFLVVVFTVTAAYWLKKSKLFFILYSLIVNLAVFLSFSLSAWLAFLLIGLPLLFLKGRSFAPAKVRPYWIKFLLIYYGSFLILFSLFINRLSFLAPESSFSRRSQLANISLKMFKSHPLTGVGLNNFTVTMAQYGYIPASTRFLQPVHNFFLLILSESGLLGLLGFLYLLFKAKKTPVLLTILFISLFDHYFFTLQQGLLLLIFTLTL